MRKAPNREAAVTGPDDPGAALSDPLPATEMWQIAIRVPAGQDVAEVVADLRGRGLEVYRAWPVGPVEEV